MIGVATVVVATLALARWTLDTSDQGADALPLGLRALIVFFTVEAARMFAQVLIGATFYEPTSWPHGHDEWPLVSVVIPAWNEEVGLAKTIDSVLASDYPSLEIIVVDDGSSDTTPQIAADYAERFPTTVFAMSQRNAGKGAALNQGVLHALGDIIVNVDADSAVAVDAIGNLVRPIVLDRADAVVGRIVVGNPKGIVRSTQAFEYTFGFHLRRTQSVLNTLYILSGAMCAYRRSCYRRTAGFRDYSKTEDLDFSLQLRNIGARLVYADDAVCVTEGAAEFRGLRSQRTRWRFGALRCLAVHRSLLFDIRPGRRALGWYELPMSVVGYLQLLLYPAVLLIAFGLPIYTGEYIYILLILCAVPLNFVVVFWAAGVLREETRRLPMLTPLMILAMAVEHVTIWAAIGQVATGRNTGWTKWQRRGVDGTAPLIPLVVVDPDRSPTAGVQVTDGDHVASVDIPDAIVEQLTSTVPTDDELDDRVTAELELLLEPELTDVADPPRP